MVASINASTSAGVVTTADTSGILQLQTASTAALTIDASQNVGIGTASPSNILDIVSASNPTIRITDTTNNCYTELNATDTVGYVGTASNHAFGFTTNNSERMRIDSSGNLLVGQTTNSQNYRFVIKGSAGTADDLAFNTDGTKTEIQSFNAKPLYLNRQGNDVIVNATSGNLLVRTNSTSGPGSNNGQGVQVYNPANHGRIDLGKTSSGTLDGIVFYYNNPTNTYVGGLTYSNTATALVTSSDVRLKQNIVDVDSQFSTINAIKVREFEFIAEPDKKVKGFVAQELFEVFPDAVQVGTEKEDGSIEKGWAVNQTALIPIMLKAIQELKAMVDSIQSEFDAYKATHP